MRARSLKPGFFKNDLLGDIAPLGRLLFQGLWCLADREGRLEERPKRIKAEILPYDECDVVALLDALEDNSFIMRFQHLGVGYLQVINFLKHQNPHKNEKASEIPPPERSSESTVQTPGQHQSDPADSLNLTPDSSFLTDDSIEQRKPTRPQSKPRKQAQEISKSQQDRFDEFWQAYPRKRNKGQAERAWSKLQPNRALFERIMGALSTARTCQDWVKEAGQYVPYPATWLNSKGWEDDYGPVDNASPLSRFGEKGQKTIAAAQAVLERRKDKAHGPGPGSSSNPDCDG